MSIRGRLIGLAVGLEAVALAYAALVAWLTPAAAQEHNTVLAAVLLALAVPLGWQAVHLGLKDGQSVGGLLAGVALPNVALLGLITSGALDMGPRPYGLLQAVTALMAAAMLAIAWRQVRVGSGPARGSANV